MMIAEQLRKSVLQAAIQGKLTEQLPSDGDARDLLAQIKKERQKLIKEGEIKKAKASESITEDEMPFEIPEKWTWVSLYQLCITEISYGIIKLGPEVHDGVKVIRCSDVKRGYIITDNIRTVSKELSSQYSRTILNGGELLINVRGSLGGCAIVPITMFGYNTAREVAVIRLLSDVNGKYVLDILQSDYFEKYMGSNLRGIAYKGLNLSLLSSLLVPLPPFAEQKRIVKRVDELMRKIDEIEKPEKELFDLNKRFPGDMKTSLLQAAIQGKLTEQLPSDGDAGDLIAQIGKERQKLVKEGKIKKENTSKPITEDEMPFEIPENWVWVRVDSLFQVINGDRGKDYPAKCKLHSSGSIPFISAINMENKTVSKEGLLFLSEKQFSKLRSGKLQKNDFVICIRGSLGKFCKYPYDTGAIASSLVILRRCGTCILDDYFDIYLDSFLMDEQIQTCQNGTAQPNLGATVLSSFYVPLPTLAEQKRIVKRLNELLPLCDELDKDE